MVRVQDTTTGPLECDCVCKVAAPVRLPANDAGEANVTAYIFWATVLAGLFLSAVGFHYSNRSNHKMYAAVHALAAGIILGLAGAKLLGG